MVVVSIAFVTIREAIHSQIFAGFVSNKITQWVSAKTNAVVKIGKIKIEFLPFGMVLEDVNVEVEKNKIELAKISVLYGLSNIFKSDIYIDDVILEEGLLLIEERKSDIAKQKIDIKKEIDNIADLWPIYYETLKTVPVKIENISLKNIIIENGVTTVSVSSGVLSLTNKIKMKLLVEKVKDGEAIKSGFVLPDSIKIDINVNQERLDVNEVVVQKGFAKISASGAIKIEKEISFDRLEVMVKGPDQAFFELLPDNYEYDKSFRAYSNSKLTLSGNLDNPNIRTELKLTNISGKYLKASELTTDINIFNNQVELVKIVVRDETGSLEVSSTDKLSILDIQKFNISSLDLSFKNFHTKTILHFLDGKLDPFDAYVSGNAKANLNNNKVQISSLKGLNLGELNLLIDPGQPLINLKSPQLSDFVLDLDFSPFKLSLVSNVELPQSLMRIKAVINSSGIEANIKSDKISFDDIENIQGLPMEGSGRLSIDIKGPWDDVIFNIVGELKKSAVAGYNLGDLKFTGVLPLRQKKIIFNTIEVEKGSTRLNGSINLALFDKPYPLIIEYDASRATYNDLIEILEPIVPEGLQNYKDIQARFNTSGKVSVDFKNKPVKLDLNVQGSSFSYQGEYFDSFSANILMGAGRLNIRNFQLQREDSKGLGSIIWDTDTSYLEYEFTMNNLSLRSFNLYRISPFSLDGNLNIDLYGSGLLKNDHSLRATVVLDNSKIKRTPVPNSRLDAYYSKGEWTIQGELMEGMSRLEAFIPSIETNKDSLVRIDVSSADIRPLVGLVSAERMNEQSLNGRVFAQIQSSFPLSHPDRANIKLDIRDIDINYKSKKFKLAKSNQVNVLNGIFKNWTIVTSQDSDVSLTSRADGDLGGSFTLDSQYKIPAQFFELLSDKLIDVTGSVDGVTSIDWNKDGIRAMLNHSGNNLQFKLRDIPGKFSDLLFKVNYSDDIFRISALNGKYGRGEFQINGDIKANFPYPSINLKLSSTNVTFPFFSKSEANFDNRFLLIGSKPPYLLNGSVTLNRVLLAEDVGTYLGKINGSNNYEKFIPNTTQSFLNQFLEVDATVVSNNSIKVSNPLMSLNLSANLKLIGPITSPQILGRVSGTPSQSKIAFKGHEFDLSKSVVEFNTESGTDKPLVDLNGKTTVSGYSIDLNVNGAVDEMNILLSSEPPLPQDEIVSLLTLGITSDISRNLNDQDRRSITTMSLGGFLFDQLQLTKDLDDNLGLKVSLAPEFSGEEGNLIEEASSDTSTARRLKTGTKLRVQSQLGQKTSVSFSSTLGGEVEQKQEMNVNYDFNRKWSLEGIYELKSSTEENQVETQSIGADVKYKWSF